MTHPYKQAPDYAFWKRSVAEPEPSLVDPVVSFPFRIAPTDKVATGGSCFAQHIARFLAKSGYAYMVTEPGHPVLSQEAREAFNYGVFSARYGNIYTSRQLLQLMLRAYGEFEPVDDIWVAADGSLLDPFRPTIQPQGFPTLQEFRRDRQQHFAAVREIFETTDVFVFTLGLTEGWINAQDGAAYPVCPGVAGGVFDAGRHKFHNEDVAEVVANVSAFITRLKSINPSVRVILTVSPVPLAATAEDRHVLVSTTYSKSVLRVAADMLSKQFDDVAYFPSYEIITGNYSRGAYYAANLRDVIEPGVEHVMRLFFKHATTAQAEAAPLQATALKARADDAALKRSAEIAKVICDEELLNFSRPMAEAAEGA